MNTSNTEYERRFNPFTTKIVESLLGKSLDSYITSERYNVFHKRFFNNITRSVSELETLCDQYVESEIISSRSRQILDLIYTKYIGPWNIMWSSVLKEFK